LVAMAPAKKATGSVPMFTALVVVVAMAFASACLAATASNASQCYSIPWVWNIIPYPRQPPTRPHPSGSWLSRPRPHLVQFSRAGDGIRFHRPVFTHTIWWTGLDRASLLFSHSTHVLGFFSFLLLFFPYTQRSRGHSLIFFYVLAPRCLNRLKHFN
jgi:hypothetical protein